MTDPIHCNWCSKSSTEVRKIISGPNVHICNECVALCAAVISADDDQFDAEVAALKADLISQLDLS